MSEQHRPTRSRQAPKLDNAIADYLLDGRARQFTPRTLEHYRGRLGAFARWAADQTPPALRLADVSPALLRTYLVYLQVRGLASNTQHTHARALRAFFNFCIREGYTTETPFDKVKMPRPDRVSKSAFTEADMVLLVRACDTDRDRALVLTVLDTGARASELCNLNVGDVNLDALAVAIRQGKGRKDRTVYIGARTARALTRYVGERPNHEPLFLSQANRNIDGRLSRFGLREILVALGKRAGVAEVHPHRFRRTFALWNLRAGVNIYALAALMGHTSIDVLKSYLALVEDDLQKAHQTAGVVDRLKL